MAGGHSHYGSMPWGFLGVVVCRKSLATAISLFGSWLAAASCDGSGAARPELEVLPPDEIVLAIGVREAIFLESLGTQEIAVSWSGGNVRCDVTPGVARSWEVIRLATAQSAPEIRNATETDPNRRVLGTVLAFVRRIDEHTFENRYVDRESEMLEATHALQAILSACSVDAKFEPLIFVR